MTVDQYELFPYQETYAGNAKVLDKSIWDPNPSYWPLDPLAGLELDLSKLTPEALDRIHTRSEFLRERLRSLRLRR